MGDALGDLNVRVVLLVEEVRRARKEQLVNTGLFAAAGAKEALGDIDHSEGAELDQVAFQFLDLDAVELRVTQDMAVVCPKTKAVGR